jgi:prepilin-type N-terminal cleavage/methylation domain-containing protein
MSRRRHGFTFIEMLMVMIVLGLLASIAVLKYIDLRHRARAAQVAADLEAVRLAAYGAWYEHNTWPEDAGAGQVPVDLVPYLPPNFSFAKPEYSLDWENFVPPGGGPSGGMQIGVVVTASTPRLRKTLEQTLGARLPFVSMGGTLTFIIIGPDGKS